MNTRRAAIIAVAVSLLAPLCGSATTAVGEPVRFDPDVERCFRQEGGTSTHYLVFKADGSYSNIAREHMGVWETDRGAWSQAESGEITLTSEARFRKIEVGPLSVYVHDTTSVARLPEVKAVVTGFLQRHTSTTFTRSEVENIQKHGYKNYLSRVSVEFPTPTVEREQLQKLVKEIDRYIADPTKNLFHLTPYRYKGLTYLLWKDFGTPLNRNRDQIHKWIDRQKAEECPELIFCQSDADRCREEYQRPQPFVFYPELNTSRTVPMQKLP